MRTEAENFDETQKAYHGGYTKGFQAGYLRGISDMGKNTESLYTMEATSF